MARPPEVNGIRRDDIPEAPAWVEKLLRPLNLFVTQVGQALQGNLTVRENIASMARGPVRVAIPAEWVALTFSSGWAQWTDSNFEPCAVRVTPDGREVEARGLVDNTGGALGAMVELPQGYSPSKRLILPATANEDDASVVVLESGTINALHGSLAAWFSLNGLRWPLSGPPPAWGAPFPLFYEWDRKPLVVWCNCERLESSGRSTGLVTTCGAEWRAGELRGKKGFFITRLSALTPGDSYNLTVHALAE